MTKRYNDESVLFKDLDISGQVLKAISEIGYEQPTPIQAQAIPVLLNGEDVLGLAQTGTGKTAAFGIPLIEKINPSLKSPQAIVLCPTRELAIQVAEDLTHLAKYTKDIRILAIYGGQSIDRQLRSLKSGVNVIIGTPGRIQDHLDRGSLDLSHINLVVLDEADEMLNMGFRESIEDILTSVPEMRQTVLFSATMAPAILKLTKRFQNNPVEVKIQHKELTVPLIEQIYVETRERDKLEVLCRFIDLYQFKLTLIFCNTKRQVDNLVEHLNARGYIADALHGDMRQNVRDKVMKKFKTGNIDILIATDVAARGLDVDDIDAVINYDFPQDEEYYVHRIGRTGRAGKKGISISFVTANEIYKLKDIKRYTNAKIMRKDVPSATDIESSRKLKLSEKIKKEISGGNLNNYINDLNYYLTDDVTLSEFAAALLKIIDDEDKKPINDIKIQEKEYSGYERNDRGRFNKRFERRRNSDFSFKNKQNDSNKFSNRKKNKTKSKNYSRNFN